MKEKIAELREEILRKRVEYEEIMETLEYYKTRSSELTIKAGNLLKDITDCEILIIYLKSKEPQNDRF